MGPPKLVQAEPRCRSGGDLSRDPPTRASDDNCYKTVRVWDAATGRPLRYPDRFLEDEDARGGVVRLQTKSRSGCDAKQ
jgi:hypothetical protein